MRSVNVRLLCEVVTDGSARKKAKSVPASIEHAAAQRRNAIKTRGLEKADREMDFFINVDRTALALRSPNVTSRLVFEQEHEQEKQ